MYPSKQHNGFHRTVTHSVVVATLALLPAAVPAAEIVRLTPATWDSYVPQGKEVDSIYGDYVLRNDQIVAVIADPIPGRNANMTVRDVRGGIIDLTRREPQSDQLSAFYPGAARFAYAEPRFSAAAAGDEISLDGDTKGSDAQGESIAFSCSAPATPGRPAATVVYRLTDGKPVIQVTTTYSNPHEGPIEVVLEDAMRADRGFDMGFEKELNLFWAYDPWWGQAYGVVANGFQIVPTAESMEKKRPIWRYSLDGSHQKTLKPDESLVLEREIFCAASLLELKALAHQMAGTALDPVQVHVSDPAGPIAGAQVTVEGPNGPYGSGRTTAKGQLEFALPAGNYQLIVSALGRPTKRVAVGAERSREYRMELERPGYVAGRITDAMGKEIACKIQWKPQGGVAAPDFGPDTAEFGVRNVRYSANGRFQHEIAPGTYDVLISHGPEFDAVTKQIEVKQGETAKFSAKLVRSVKTPGWVSSDFHSHSSPSGDNTSSQLGRVLNLLAEHIEFAPCTEHNRLSTYVPHLKHLGAEQRMATCVGIELTGRDGSVNHQNAFPLKPKPRTQDGGAPLADVNPIPQIERLAMWDANSEKLVQTNHPNIVRMAGDRDQDGQPDGGFASMFGLMDVIEVHPPSYILSKPDSPQQVVDGKNRIFHWLQLLNLGYRIPGVVNTDAHYNFHGSGFLRNYIKSRTDDPAKIDVMDMVHSAEAGHLIMTNGPYLEVSFHSGEPQDGDDGAELAIAGDDVEAPGGQGTLHVRVQCPNWLDINRIQVFVNGRPSEGLNFTRRTHPDRFSTDVVRFDGKIPLELDSDAHVIVAAAGEGLTLGAVVGPDRADDMPIAVSNPIFVDVDGGGFQSNQDLLDVAIPVAKQ